LARTGPIPLFEPLMRPIKFVKASGLFVFGGYSFQEGGARWVIYNGDASNKNNGDASNKKTHWTKVFDKASSQLYFPAAAAYGRVGGDEQPTFIMVGQENYFGTSDEDPPFFKIIILTSRDGKDWKETFTEKDGFGYAAAWDEKNKRFLVQCVSDMAPEVYSHSVFSSSDGLNWSKIETEEAFGPEPQPSNLMMATGTSLVTDSLGNTVPNGSYFGLDGSMEPNQNATIIKPTVLNPYYGAVSDGGEPNSVEIIKREVDPESGNVSTTTSHKAMSFPVSSVTYAGGVYQACGTDEGGVAVIASSSDGGISWSVDLELSNHHGLCVIAGPEAK